jgi:putative membrane-bound dehydrogenase-like protein
MGAASRILLSQRWPCWLLVLILACEVSLSTARAVDKVPRQAVNTQDPADIPPTPAEALAKITVPDGFHVSLFAGEPDVHQPLAFCFDDRGRLWVVENYSYPEWNEGQHDRIVIFEDVDNDGRFDKRKVFLEKGEHLTGIEIGFGGVWCTAPPYLIFIPDRDGDDRPDSAAEILLDGFNLREVGHNVVNGLKWGPDGWLYGRHGIKATSHVGRPGSDKQDRIWMNCSIWRFHPTRETLEVVTHGTTNPWGFDYDDTGEMFFTNNVIGHLWHVVPGAHYDRMYGTHFNANLYQLMPSCSDHLHWDSEDWTKSRKVIGVPNQHDAQGGGHSHCGGMIYLGDNWPKEYRGRMLMCNTHGKRVNQDLLVRRGSSYVARHGADFLMANSDWFRGVELKYGPDGGVYVMDWTELGECHDRDGIHRRSGRIYKVVYGAPPAPRALNLQTQSNRQLVDLQLHRNDWFVRHARRILQERAARGDSMQRVHYQLSLLLGENKDVTRQLRALWALHVTGGLREIDLVLLLGHEREEMRKWAVRLMVSAEYRNVKTADVLAAHSREEVSGLVRLHLASALGRLELADRWPLAGALAQSAQDRQDRQLVPLLWYGIEPAVMENVPRALRLAQQTKIEMLRTSIARRITVEVDRQPEALAQLLAMAASWQGASKEEQRQLLAGIRDGLQGRRQLAMPANWDRAQANWRQTGDPQIATMLKQVGVIFGDGVAMKELLKTARDKNMPAATRRSALQSMVSVKAPGTAALLQSLVNDRAVQSVAIGGLAAFDDPSTAEMLLNRYSRMDRPQKEEIVEVLTTRPAYALKLLAAVEKNQVRREDISAQQAQQLNNLGSAQVREDLERVWGSIQVSSAEQQRQLLAVKQMLQAAESKPADLAAGRALYKKRCANCHRLFGDGENIGPDLTGSGRANLDYILQNTVTPSAVVAAGYRVSIVATKDGRVLTGIVNEVSPQLITVQTAKERVRLQKADVEQVKGLAASLMPDNLLKELNDQQVLNLIRYLASPRQVALSTVGSESSK